MSAKVPNGDPVPSDDDSPPEMTAEADAEVSTESGAEESLDVAIEVDDADDADPSDDGEGELSLEQVLNQKVEQLEVEKKELYERLLRTTADLDNFRKRSRREIEDARVDSKSRTLRDVLPVIDNLERAMAHAESAAGAGGGAEGILEGVKLVMRQFEKTLDRLDVRPVEAEGLIFDPNVHEAMSQIEVADKEPGTVVQVLQAGYSIGARLLRPALVVVSKRPPEEPAAGPNGKSATADAAPAEPEAAVAEAESEGAVAEAEPVEADSAEAEAVPGQDGGSNEAATDDDEKVG